MQVCLDLFAEELLGKEAVAKLKVAAILDALRKCSDTLKTLNFGEDALEVGLGLGTSETKLLSPLLRC